MFGGNRRIGVQELTDWLAIYAAHIKRCRALGLKPMSLIRLYEIVWKFEPIHIPVFVRKA